MGTQIYLLTPMDVLFMGYILIRYGYGLFHVINSRYIVDCCHTLIADCSLLFTHIFIKHPLYVWNCRCSIGLRFPPSIPYLCEGLLNT